MSRVLTLLAMWLLVVAFPVGALAHDPHTHQANALADAKSKSGGLCCDGKDYTIPDDWRRTETGYKVMIGTTWYEVPKDAEVNNMRNPDAEAKVWIYNAEGETWIRCFLPGMEV